MQTTPIEFSNTRVGSLAQALVPCFFFLALAVGAVAQTSAPVRYQDQLFHSDVPEPQDGFGWKVELDGEWAAVAHRLDDRLAINAGTVRMFRRGEGGLEFFQDLLPGDAVQSLRMGSADMHLLGNLLAIDAQSMPYVLAGTVSTVYVYEFDGLQWGAPIRLQPSDWNLPARDGWGFGYSVNVVDPNTILIGAVVDAVQTVGSPPLQPQTDQHGAIYVFQRSANGWEETQKLDPMGPVPMPGQWYSEFGYSICSDGDTAIVGNKQGNHPGREFWATVLTRDAQGRWHESGHIFQPNGTRPWDRFGYSMDMEGDLLAIGAPVEVDSLYVRTGFVEVFRLVQGEWLHEATLEASDGVASGNESDWFGGAVSVSGGRILVGAKWARPDGGPTRLGSAYLFEQQGGVWTETKRLWEDNPVPPSAPWPTTTLGHDVDLDGDTALISNEAGPAGGLYWAGTVGAHFLPFGTQTCSGESNTTGESAWIQAVGSREISIGHLALRVGNLPVGQAGYMLAGREETLVLNPGGSAGHLCVGGSVARLRQETAVVDADGNVEIAVPTGALPTNPVSAIAPGDTWHFQMWYRDNSASSNSNFSSALAVTFH